MNAATTAYNDALETRAAEEAARMQGEAFGGFSTIG